MLWIGIHMILVFLCNILEFVSITTRVIFYVHAWIALPEFIIVGIAVEITT